MHLNRMEDAPPPPDTDDFLSRLQLTQVDRDIFTGWCHAGAPLRAFGGQVAAQALVAAGVTVADEQRHVHSLHSYFLRAGRTSDHIVYGVERLRDGRSFSTRRVRAVQFGETIFAMSASFAPQQSGPVHQRDLAEDREVPAWWPELPAPEGIAAETVFDHVLLAQDTDERDRLQILLDAGYPERQILDMRVIMPQDAARISGGRFDRMVWLRTPQPLPDDDLIHVCALTYFSDLTLVSTVTGHHGGRRGTHGLQISSIDHAMWFHNTFRADQWLLFATDSPIAGHGRGYARGQFFAADGTLVASAAQEVLLRAPDPT